MNFFQKKADRTISNFVEGSLERLTEVKPGECPYNYKCHKNAVHHAIKNNEDHVAMVMYKQSHLDTYFIHFLNIDKDGVFTDNTLGEWSATTKYYFVKKIPSKDFFNIDNIFENYRQVLSKKVHWLVRLFSDTNY